MDRSFEARSSNPPSARAAVRPVGGSLVCVWRHGTFSRRCHELYSARAACRNDTRSRGDPNGGQNRCAMLSYSLRTASASGISASASQRCDLNPKLMLCGQGWTCQEARSDSIAPFLSPRSRRLRPSSVNASFKAQLAGSSVIQSRRTRWRAAHTRSEEIPVPFPIPPMTRSPVRTTNPHSMVRFGGSSSRTGSSGSGVSWRW